MGTTYKYYDGKFYPSDVSYASIPDDAINVSEQVFLKAMNRQQDEAFSIDEKGKITIFKNKVSKDELDKQAKAMRSILKARADSEISWRSDAVSSGEATEEEISDLEKWTKYRIALMRTDLSTFPDVSWPKPISK